MIFPTLNSFFIFTTNKLIKKHKDLNIQLKSKKQHRKLKDFFFDFMISQKEQESWGIMGYFLIVKSKDKL